MKPNLHQIFKKMREVEPSSQLAGLILARIERLQERQIRTKLFLVHFSLAASLGATVWAAVEYGSAFLQSDFWILLQLLLTDASAVLRNWNDFAFSLLETFPAVSVTVILIPIFALLLSFAAYFKLVNRRHYNYI